MTGPARLLRALHQHAGLSGPVAAALVVGFLLVPLLPGEFAVIVATEVLILGLFALSFNLLHGYMGQISFGHAAFFGLGAYATALIVRAGQAATGSVGYGDFILALLAAPVLAGAGAVIVGFFCVRLTGIYFAILSLAFGELIFHLVFTWYGFTGGDNGIQGLLPPPWFRDSVNYYYFTLGVVSLAAAALWLVTRSPFGFALRMIRDNQKRAAFVGVNVRLCMYVNFVIAGTFAGIAGGLWGPFARSVSPALLGWMHSGVPVFMTLIGGGAHFVGPMVGSVIYTGLNAYVTRFTTYWPLAIGMVILLMVLFLPGGVLSVLQRAGRPRKPHHAPTAASEAAPATREAR